MCALPWYKDGLNFKCTECGKCCSGPKGYIWITPEELTSMAAFLQISEKEFKIKYTRQRDNRISLTEKKNAFGEYDCIFLKEKKCQIYQTRPKQCRTYPWWKEHLTSPESWELAAQECEGINNEAPLKPYVEIKNILSNDN